jgi:hypothetical protein
MAGPTIPPSISVKAPQIIEKKAPANIGVNFDKPEISFGEPQKPVTEIKDTTTNNATPRAAAGFDPVDNKTTANAQSPNPQQASAPETEINSVPPTQSEARNQAEKQIADLVHKAVGPKITVGSRNPGIMGQTVFKYGEGRMVEVKNPSWPSDEVMNKLVDAQMAGDEASVNKLIESLPPSPYQLRPSKSQTPAQPQVNEPQVNEQQEKPVLSDEDMKLQDAQKEVKSQLFELAPGMSGQQNVKVWKNSTNGGGFVHLPADPASMRKAAERSPIAGMAYRASESPQIMDKLVEAHLKGQKIDKELLFEVLKSENASTPSGSSNVKPQHDMFAPAAISFGNP